MTRTMPFLHILIFVMLLCCTSCVKYKCYRDICDSTQHFCNDAEQRCERCGPFECSGENNYVKLNQCTEACERLGLKTTEGISTLPPNNYISKDPIPIAILIVVIIILAIVIAVPVIICCRKEKQQLREYAPVVSADEADGKSLNLEAGLQLHRLPLGCTDNNEKHPSAPPSYESQKQSPVCSPTDSSSDQHPANTDLLRENQMYEEAHSSSSQSSKDNIMHDEVTPKTSYENRC